MPSPGCSERILRHPLAVLSSSDVVCVGRQPAVLGKGSRMASLFRPTYPDKKTGKPKRLKRWYAKYRDATSAVRKVPLSTNKAAAQLMLGDLLARVERERAGVVDRTAEHAAAPI